MAEYLDGNIEITVDQRLFDIVKDGYDAGVRVGEQIDQDIFAVGFGPDMNMIVAASRGYFENHPVPEIPARSDRSGLHQP